ncbi:hypothetical protein INT45_009931, partial [Circinella minor]
CPTKACGYFKWDNSASKFTVHPTNAYALDRGNPRLSSFHKAPIGYNVLQESELSQKEKTIIEFRLHSSTEISIHADHNPTLLPALQKMDNSKWNDDLQKWIIPATSHAYARALQQITVAPNLNIQIKRLSNALKQVLYETSGQSDVSVDIVESDVEEAIYQIRDTALWKTLKPFQREGVRCCLRRQGRLLLADDMGKKLQALVFSLVYQHAWPVLIICPKETQQEWFDLVVKWLPVEKEDVHISTNKTNILGKTRKRKTTHKGLYVKTQTKNDRNKKSKYNNTRSDSDDDDDDSDDEAQDVYEYGQEDEDEGVSLFSPHKFHIISNELTNRFSKELLERHFRVVICDSSEEYLKFRPRARAQKDFIPVLQNCERLLLLSNEFDLTKPLALYTQLSVLRRDLFSDFRRYGQHYCNAVQNVFGWDYGGTSNQVELQYIVDNVILLKRTKEDIQDQLPLN